MNGKKKTNFSWKPLKLETSWHDKDKIKIAPFQRLHS